jgi:repressor LexA
LSDKVDAAYILAGEHSGVFGMSEKPLSERQKNMLEFINNYMAENGRPPTIREIGAACNISSTSVVNYNLTRLKEKGLLERDAEVSRGLRITEKARAIYGNLWQTANDAMTNLLRIPMAGNIVAGEPIDVFEGAYDYDDAVEVSASMINGRTDDLYALRVSGDSMIDAMVNDGDIVIMRSVHEIRDGDMVAALIDDDTTTLKYIYNEGSQIRLQLANPTMEPIYVEPERVQVQGKVMMIVRQMP